MLKKMKPLLEKLKDALLSVAPITLIVVVLYLTGLISNRADPAFAVSQFDFTLFLVSAAFLVLGMALFTLGADQAMMPMGNAIGSSLTKTKKIVIIVLLAFSLGALITMAEPDLSVLADQVPINKYLLILIVAAGVGLFLVIGILRVLFQKSLNILLIVFYGLVFMMANLCNKSFLPLSFDSGGVTTGPITVPFIMALCAGFAATRGGKKSNEDSFGLIALCSIGPIFCVVLMGIFFKGDPIYEPEAAKEYTSIFQALFSGMPKTLKEVTIAILPVVAFFYIYQAFKIKLSKRQLIKIGVGVVYTFVGLILFLNAVNVGFSSVGLKIGESIAKYGEVNGKPWLIVLLGGIIGLVVVLAEPAVAVLNKQVEEISGGTITKRSMLLSLSIGVGVSIALSIIRIHYQFSIMYYLVPGYIVAIGLSFMVPKLYTAIAFDSGGVASGPMTSTFILPFAIGACNILAPGEVMNYAFGIVSMVALTPLLTIQFLGFKMVAAESLSRRAARKRIREENEAQIIYFE